MGGEGHENGALFGSRADPERIAALLAAGRVGALAVGRAEVGPRALGHRSILADPRSPAMRELLNGLVKRREAFRPLAPVCLAEDLDTYFVRPRATAPLDVMLVPVECRPGCVAELPSIVHRDGTARVQVVDDPDELIARVLVAFRSLTGAGVLINTSFNGPGEPLVDDERDAVQGFLRLGLDFVVVGDYLLTHEDPASVEEAGA
jgi:carbamoyltransferase